MFQNEQMLTKNKRSLKMKPITTYWLEHPPNYE